MVPFESLDTVSYSPSIVTMAVYLAISEIFSVKHWPDLEVHKVHKVLTLTAKKRDQRGLQNGDKNKLVEIKVKLEAN